MILLITLRLSVFFKQNTHLIMLLREVDYVSSGFVTFQFIFHS